MSIYEALEQWLQQCEYLDSYIYFNVIPVMSDTTSLVPVQGENVLDTFIDGTKRKEFPFNIDIVKPYDSSGTSDLNRESIEIFNSVTEWIEDKLNNNDYPDLGELITVENIEQMYSVPQIYVSNEDQELCNYENRYKLTYIERKR